MSAAFPMSNVRPVVSLNKKAGSADAKRADCTLFDRILPCTDRGPAGPFTKTLAVLGIISTDGKNV